MLEKRSVKGTIKTMGKSYRRPLIGLLIVSFQGFSWTNEQFVYALVRRFYRATPSCGCKVSKASDHRNGTTEVALGKTSG